MNDAGNGPFLSEEVKRRRPERRIGAGQTDRGIVAKGERTASFGKKVIFHDIFGHFSPLASHFNV